MAVSRKWLLVIVLLVGAVARVRSEDSSALRNVEKEQLSSSNVKSTMTETRLIESVRVMMKTVAKEAKRDTNKRHRRRPPPPPSPPPPAPAPAPPSSYDHMQVIQSWVPVYCLSISCKPNLQEKFYMHGLWPANSTGYTLQNCPVTANLSSKDFPLLMREQLKDLRTNWPSISSSKSEGYFWSHEWTDHGVCAGNDYKDYFIKGITIARKYDIILALTSSGIRLDPHAEYSQLQIKNAVQRLIGANNNVYISCWDTGDGTYRLLREVYFCVGKDLHTLISCPFSTDEKNCGPQSTPIRVLPF